MTKFIITTLLIFLTISSINAAVIKIKSPNKKADIVFSDTEDKLSYTVTYNNKIVIDQSGIQFKLKSQPLFKSLKITETKRRVEDKSWQPILKQHETIRDNYTEVEILVKELVFPGRSFKIIARAYDNGVAFRYSFNNKVGINNHLLLEEELTEFNLPGNPVCWRADYEHFLSHQESEFIPVRKKELSEKAVIGLPLTIEFSENLFASITEAHLEDYAGMYLKYDGKTLKSLLSPLPENNPNNHKFKVKQKLPALSPWRTIIIGENPGDLVESELVMNLNPSCEIEDPSWIKPGLCAWDSWWSQGVQMDTETIKKYIDLAAQQNFQYMLIDWQWYGPFNRESADVTTVNSDVDMKVIRKYAEDKNVKLWLWLYWSDISRKMEEAFKLYESWGIVGIKIDFMARDDQEMVEWYHNTTRLAAKYHLMVNYHGAYKPTGLRRTLPNLMTREGVLGNEYNKWSYRATPDHNVTLPYTRMVAGPIDYTPGGFNNKSIGHFKPQRNTATMGTRCHELAKFVVYNSPITTVCDHPDNYKDEIGIEFISEIPAQWDDTKVLDGKIGEYIVMARKFDDKWYLAAMTNSSARKITINTSFIRGKLNIKQWIDGSNAETDATDINVLKTKPLDEYIEINMAPGGGWVAILE